MCSMSKRKFLEIDKWYTDPTGKEWKCIATGTEAHCMIDRKSAIQYVPQGDEHLFTPKVTNAFYKSVSRIRGIRKMYKLLMI